MPAQWTDFIRAFSEVKKVRETLRAYCLAPDKVPVSIDDLIYAILQEYETTVTTYPFPVPTVHLRGMIEIRQDKTATIWFDAVVNEKYQRYVVVKELAQVMIMNAENITVDPTAIIEHYVLGENPFGPNVEDYIATEELAKVVAVELLFPYALRSAARKRIAGKEDSLVTLSEWLIMPDWLVEWALTENYESLCGKLWNSVGIDP